MNIAVIQDLHVKRFFGDTPDWLPEGGKIPLWELVRDFVVEVDGESHVVPKGFVFDGSTIPRWLWWLYPPSFPAAWRGACLHDKGVAFAWKGKPQSYWDDVLYHMMLQDGAKPFDAWVFRKTVGLSPRGAYKLKS